MKIILVANTDWYLYNYVFPLAKKLISQSHKVLLISPKGNYADKFKHHSIQWKQLILSRRGFNPIHELRSLIQLSKLYKMEMPELVHHFTAKCVLFGSLAARLNSVKKIVNTLPGKGILFSEKNVFLALFWRICKLLFRISLKKSKVIFQNQSDLNYFTENKITNKLKCYLIPGSGVSIENFYLTPIPNGIPLIVLPGRMLWAKGAAEFVKAAEIIKSKGVEVRFALVGKIEINHPSAIRPEIIKDWEKNGYIEWWGWQTNMVSVYHQSTIVCLPSTYGEGLPKSLIEAAACGRPLVATDIPGCRPVIKNGVNGHLVPRGDADTLARVLIEMLGDRELLELMGAASRKIAERDFSVEKITDSIIEIYDLAEN